MVHTSYEVTSKKTLETYQYTVNNNFYQDGNSLPSAVFAYDISPMQVQTPTRTRRTRIRTLT